MRTLSPVVWAEGMHLAQHHFQQQARFFEDTTAFALSALFFEPFGVVDFELDHEALLNGTVSVTHGRGVMPDGLAFHFPEDPPPKPLEIRDAFSPTRDAHLIHLTIPEHRPEGPNCGLDGVTEAVRFLPSTVRVVDETSGQGQTDVMLARKNFGLALDDALPEGVGHLPIARVRRDGSGQFIYDADYVPPCLQIRASSGLLDRLRRLVDILDEKASTLARQRRGSGGIASEYAASEIWNFWLTHAVHASLPPLRHMLSTRSAHPEELYREMSRLAGALCTFTVDAHPRDLPLYDHMQLQETFAALDAHVRRHLEVVIPTGSLAIPLQETEPSFFAGPVVDRRCLEPASEWYLVVHPGSGNPQIASLVPRLVKICSAKHIVRLVKEAFPGLPLEYVATPPSALSPRVGARYFRVEKSDPCWRSIHDTGSVGLYVPAALEGSAIEVAVILPRK